MSRGPLGRAILKGVIPPAHFVRPPPLKGGRMEVLNPRLSSFARPPPRGASQVTR